MAVRIRMKKLGRRHRPFFRICAMDVRTPRDGRAIEELGTYDPMVRDTDARAILKKERIDYWLSVGAQPSDKVKTLIKKYGTNGTHLPQQETALQTLAAERARPMVAAVAKPAATEAPEGEAEGETPAPAEAEAPAETEPVAAEQPAPEKTDE